MADNRFIASIRSEYPFNACVLDTHSFDFANEPDCICMCFDVETAEMIARKLNAIDKFMEEAE